MKKKLLGILALLVAISTGLTSVFASTNILRISNNKDVKFVDPTYKGTIEFGDEICLGTECFYVLDTNETSTTLLSKYNLYVGNKVKAIMVEGDDEDVISYDPTPLGDEETKIQNENAIGAAAEDKEEGTFYGTVEYNDELITNYLADYERYIEDNYDITLDARIPNSDDMHFISCDISDACNSADVPEWAKNTTYWTNIPGQNEGTVITRSKNVKTQNSRYNVSSGELAGIRPVIVLSTIDLNSNIIEIKSSDVEKGSSYLQQTEEDVVVNVEVSDGYEVDKVTAKDANGKDVKVTEKDGKYFISKADITSKVEITITYKETKQAPTIENPETVDNVSLMIALFSLSVLGLTTSLYLRKRNN